MNGDVPLFRETMLTVKYPVGELFWNTAAIPSSTVPMTPTFSFPVVVPPSPHTPLPPTPREETKFVPVLLSDPFWPKTPRLAALVASP
jgi:hypothetical protein